VISQSAVLENKTKQNDSHRTARVRLSPAKDCSPTPIPTKLKGLPSAVIILPITSLIGLAIVSELRILTRSRCSSPEAMR
jgi:hypothetical protein